MKGMLWKSSSDRYNNMRNLPPLTMTKKRGRPRKTDPVYRAKRRKIFEEDLGSQSEGFDDENRRVTRSQIPEEEREVMASPFLPSKLTNSEVECVLERLIPTKTHVHGRHGSDVRNEDVLKKGITGWGQWGRKVIETQEQPGSKKVGRGNYKRRIKKKLVAEELYNHKQGRAVNNEFKRQLLQSYADSLQKWAESGFPKRSEKRGRKDARRHKSSLESCTQPLGSVVLVRNIQVNASTEWYPAVLISRTHGFCQTVCEETKELDVTHDDDEGSISNSSLGSFSVSLAKTEVKSLGNRQERKLTFTVTDRDKHDVLVRSFDDDNYHLVSPSCLRTFYPPGIDSDCEAEALLKAVLFAEYCEIPDSWEDDVLALDSQG